MDKGDVVRVAATSAVKSIMKLCSPETVPVIFKHLKEILQAGKWKTKVGVLDSLKGFTTIASEEVGNELVNILPAVENAMHDTKQEVSQISWIFNRF
jgi:elongation factor 3